MVDRLTPEQRSRNMRAIGPKDTKPELVLRRMLHGLGYRYRLHRKDLPGKPDMVFPARRKVVLIHGCFWHLHGCRIGKMPASRTDYWAPKLARNKERDAQNQEKLAALGWDVLVVWECETKDQGQLARRLQEFLGPPGSQEDRRRATGGTRAGRSGSPVPSP